MHTAVSGTTAEVIQQYYSIQQEERGRTQLSCIFYKSSDCIYRPFVDGNDLSICPKLRSFTN